MVIRHYNLFLKLLKFTFFFSRFKRAKDTKTGIKDNRNITKNKNLKPKYLAKIPPDNADNELTI